ncbi:hypothetical protein TraAM80_09517 [Trypanosoma rangeli]|uniref:Uncharacterized protein n=1 Tax=Trypanosoma rangeli TaxID=5698 RepID=A0A422MV04_TRYRA|nr:uncharacterized protein TraAM80_09517 [Trypanosoma rangeli]RNE97068.1 hypothetical protein TraAM80_09517 [Trypanosoma rangeli]|eukprot:RNE97068.1 hypothetical protein TraAM80_09517 [Trypanosoma rangeli]
MSHLSLPARRPGAAATRRSSSPASVVCECLRPLVGAAQWQAVPRVACSRCPTTGASAARALTAPTPRRKITAHRRKGLHTFPSDPSRELGLGFGTQTGSARNDLAAAACAEDDVPPASQTQKAASSAVASSSASYISPGAVRTTSEAATVVAVHRAAAAAGVNEDSGKKLRESLSRRGLSVHATPFCPRAATALSVVSRAETSELGPFFPSQHAQQPEVGSRQPWRTRAPAPEFPRTPLASELTGVRLPTTSCNVASATLLHVSSVASFGGGDSLQLSTSLPSPLPAATTLYRPQVQQQQHVLHYAFRVGGSSSDTLFSPSDMREGSLDNDVRHRRVPFTDAEAMDEAAMLHLLRGSSSSSSVAYHDDDDDDDDDAVCMEQLPHLLTLDAAATLQTSLDAGHYAGGFWDLEGPSAATRRFLHRGASSTASLALTTQSSGGSPTGPLRNGATRRWSGGSGFNNDGDDDLWEMNSSAYADSLDDAQVEWIEQQLRAKENPDDFFF